MREGRRGGIGTTNHAPGKSISVVEIYGWWKRSMYGVWVLATGRRRDAPIKYTEGGGVSRAPPSLGQAVCINHSVIIRWESVDITGEV